MRKVKCAVDGHFETLLHFQGVGGFVIPEEIRISDAHFSFPGKMFSILNLQAWSIDFLCNVFWNIKPFGFTEKRKLRFLLYFKVFAILNNKNLVYIYFFELLQKRLRARKKSVLNHRHSAV